MKSINENQWLNISSSDYEAHMSAPSVLQLQALNKIFKDVLSETKPKSVLVLGCTTGNGFEHLFDYPAERIVGVDINEEYLAVCRKRFSDKLPKLELICSDLMKINIAFSFDLIHAALIFEYVDVQKVLEKISNWLKPNGILSVVLQLPGDASAPVSETPCESIKLLSSVINLVDVKEFILSVRKLGLREIKCLEVNLQKGKKFLITVFKN